MDLIVVLLLCIVTILCLTQILISRKIYVQKNDLVKPDRNSKEWQEFVSLFLDRKICHEGYIVSFSVDGTEEMMLHFNSLGTSYNTYKEQNILEYAYFQYCGHNEYDDPARLASYHLTVDDIVNVTQIEEGGRYFTDDCNSFFCKLFNEGWENNTNRF